MTIRIVRKICIRLNKKSPLCCCTQQFKQCHQIWSKIFGIVNSATSHITFYRTIIFIQTIHIIYLSNCDTGTSSIDIMHSAIYGPLFLLYGRICLVGMSSFGLVFGCRFKMGPRSYRKQIAFVPFGGMGDTSIADNLRFGDGKS